MGRLGTLPSCVFRRSRPGAQLETAAHACLMTAHPRTGQRHSPADSPSSTWPSLMRPSPPNPCRLRGAGTPKATRPSRALTAAEALQLAEQLGRDRRTERYSALLLVLAFGGLRFGEATALRRSDVLSGGRLRVERSVRRIGGRWVIGEPKTEAGRRTVSLPAAIAAALEQHLMKHVASS